MLTSPWTAVPDTARSRIVAEFGEPIEIMPAAGINNDFAARIRTADDVVFWKGSRGPAESLRHEVAVSSALPRDAAPAIRAVVESGGWLLVAFEHIDGRHPNLEPGSADLTLITKALSRLNDALTPNPTTAPRLAEQWYRMAPWRRMAAGSVADDLDPWARDHLAELAAREAADVTQVDGDTLLHTDLNPGNLLVDTDKRLRVVDWAWSRQGAAHVDTAMVIPRLLVAGHTMTGAERWAATVPVWNTTSEEARTSAAVLTAGIWESVRRRTGRLPDLTSAALRWMRHRLTA